MLKNLVLYCSDLLSTTAHCSWIGFKKKIYFLFTNGSISFLSLFLISLLSSRFSLISAMVYCLQWSNVVSSSKTRSLLVANHCLSPISARHRSITALRLQRRLLVGGWTGGGQVWFVVLDGYVFVVDRWWWVFV